MVIRQQHDTLRLRTCTTEVVRREGMDGPVFEVVWVGTSGPACCETLQPQPVGKPGHVAVAVERVGDEIEGSQ